MQGAGIHREVTRLISGIPASDGAGVRLTRVIGSPEQNMFDPFLLLDVIESDQADDYIAGFPPHPHRGFETFTWLLNGRMRHEDNAGNGGLIESNGAQWMNAGSGIVHSEMPEQEDGLLRGVQLWINRPAKLKMTAPAYSDLRPADIPVEKLPEGGQVRVMAGRSASGLIGPVLDSPTYPLLMDVSLSDHGEFRQSIPDTHNAFIWVAEGEVEIEGTVVPAGVAAMLSESGELLVRCADASARFLVAAGMRLNEPVARGGPFVMNTKAEILQAFADFQSGALGGAYHVPGQRMNKEPTQEQGEADNG